MFDVRLKPSAEKELERIDKRYYSKILAALAVLAQNPYLGKKLSGDREGEWSYRVWPYRIIYRIYKHELIVFIIRIKHRQGAYR